MPWLPPNLAGYFIRHGVYAPILVSLGLLVWLWHESELYGKSGTLFCVWFVLAAVTQLFASSPGVWVVAMLAQVALAIVLVFKQTLSDYV